MSDAEERAATRAAMQPLCGVALSRIEAPPADPVWAFNFEDGSRLNCECLWRLVHTSVLRASSLEHGAKWGEERTPHDVDGILTDALLGKQVTAVDLGSTTADLTLTFETGHELQLFVASTAFEAWQLQLASGALFVGRSDEILVWDLK